MRVGARVKQTPTAILQNASRVYWIYSRRLKQIPDDGQGRAMTDNVGEEWDGLCYTTWTRQSVEVTSEVEGKKQMRLKSSARDPADDHCTASDQTRDCGQSVSVSIIESLAL